MTDIETARRIVNLDNRARELRRVREELTFEPYKHNWIKVGEQNNLWSLVRDTLDLSPTEITIVCLEALRNLADKKLEEVETELQSLTD